VDDPGGAEGDEVIIPVLVCLASSLTAGPAQGPPGVAVPALTQAEQEAVVEAANRAIARHLKGEKDKAAPNDVPAALWGDAITRLKPIRVRDDRVNVAIVLSEAGGVEEGLYVSVPISSYAPQAADFAVLERLGDGAKPTFGYLYQYRLAPKGKKR
jgi:hypothetical protein